MGSAGDCAQGGASASRDSCAIRSASLGCPPLPAVPASGCGMIGLDMFICYLFEVRFLLGSRRRRAGLEPHCGPAARAAQHALPIAALRERGAAAIVFGSRTCLGCLPTFLSTPPGSADPSRTLRGWVLADPCPTWDSVPRTPLEKNSAPQAEERERSCVLGGMPDAAVLGSPGALIHLLIRVLIGIPGTVTLPCLHASHPAS